MNVTPIPAGPVWRDEIPEISDQCRVAYAWGILLTVGDVKFFESDALAVDSSFFSMFGFILLEGNKETVLNKPKSIVISEEIADKYFGTTSAIGKAFKVDNKDIYTITGIMENPPKNSVIPAKILLSWDYRMGQNYSSGSWGNNSICTYVHLIPEAQDSIVNRKIFEVTNIHKADNTITFEVNPIHRIHLYSYFGFGKSPGAILYVYIFTVVAIFVLIIACINFMNMATAKASLRAREIGIRKVNGAPRNQLIRQHLFESSIQTFLSLIIAVVIVLSLLNKFNEISGKDIVRATIFSFKYILGLLSIGIIAALMAGLYPAFYLSAIKPIQSIRGSNDFRKGSGLLRKVLVVFQFSLSIILICGALIVNKQLNYMRSAKLGFNKYHLLNIPLQGGVNQYYPTLKEEFKKNPDIQHVSASIDQVYNIGSNSSNITWPDKPEDQEVLVSFSAVDYDFTDAMEIHMLEGRGFSEEYQGDIYRDTTANFIINKTLADIIAKPDIVGMSLNFMGIQGKIVGIMDDFHFKPLRNEVEPLAMIPMPKEYLNQMIIRLRTEDLQKTIKDMETTWNSLVPKFPFQYSFFDDEIDKMYRSEERMAKLMTIFTFIAVFIACMGLFALASFASELRIREIGIRKTFGASESRIVRMMIFDTTRLILISLIIGLYLSWLLAFNNTELGHIVYRKYLFSIFVRFN